MKISNLIEKILIVSFIIFLISFFGFWLYCINVQPKTKNIDNITYAPSNEKEINDYYSIVYLKLLIYLIIFGIYTLIMSWLVYKFEKREMIKNEKQIQNIS